MEIQRNQLTGGNVAGLDQSNSMASEKNLAENEANIQNKRLKEAWSANSDMFVADEVSSRVLRKKNYTKPWLELMTSFAASVSIVGLRYVANTSASTFRRSIWILLILIGAGFTTFQIQDRIRRYAGYPVNVIVKVEHMEEMRFPTVTICNENMLSFSKVSEYGKWRLCDFSTHVRVGLYTTLETDFSLCFPS